MLLLLFKTLEEHFFLQMAKPTSKITVLE